MADAGSLATLPVGQTRRIEALGAELSDDLCRGLMDHGLLPGTAVRVLHRFGDALVLTVRGTRLMVHAGIAAQVRIEDVQPLSP